jgi:hypothetical protein
VKMRLAHSPAGAPPIPSDTTHRRNSGLTRKSSSLPARTRPLSDFPKRRIPSMILHGYWKEVKLQNYEIEEIKLEMIPKI